MANTLVETLTHRWQRYQFGRRQQLAFLGVFYRLMGEGAGIRETLEQMGKAQDPQWRQVARDTRQRLLEGQPLSQAFEAWCDGPVCEALRGPEQTHDHARLAWEAIQRLNQDTAHYGAWVAQLLPPLGYIVLTLAIYAMLAARFFPAIERIAPAVSGGGAYWVKLTGEALLVGWPFIVGALVALVAGVATALPRWSGPWRMRLDQGLPLSLYKALVAARFQQQLGILMGGGNDLKTSLRILLASCPAHTADYLWAMQARLPQGYDQAAILDVGLLHPWDINELQLLSATQGFQAAMQALAEEARERAVERLRWFTQGLRTFLYLVMAVLLLGFLKAVTSPISQLLQHTGGQ